MQKRARIIAEFSPSIGIAFKRSSGYDEDGWKGPLNENKCLIKRQRINLNIICFIAGKWLGSAT